MSIRLLAYMRLAVLMYAREHTLVSIHAFGCVDVPLDMFANHHTPPFLILNLFEQSA